MVAPPAPLENMIRVVTCGFSGYQAAQDGFSVDRYAAEVGDGEVAAVVLAVGDALGDALVRPGRVVVPLVLGQDGAQVRLTEN
jgi:hypothetical protein